jgi:NAD(P)H-dependent flavin oxidoreductase YrpB (nitropropane dioxygenase family)
MNAVAHSELVAAVSNAGGLGVIGGLTFTPKRLRAELEEVKSLLDDPEAFRYVIEGGGGGARPF